MADPILISVPVSKLRCDHEWNVRRGSQDAKGAAELESLRESIAAQGVIQPIDVQEMPGGTYAVVAGFRRATLSIELSAEETATGKAERRVPAIVRKLNEAEARAINLAENLGRKSLRPNELARGLESYQRAAPTEKQEQIGKRFGITQQYVSQLLKIRGKGSPELLAWWDQFPETSVLVLYQAVSFERSKQLGELRSLLKGAPKTGDKPPAPFKLAMATVQEVLRKAKTEAGKKPAAWRDGCGWALRELGIVARSPGDTKPTKAPAKSPAKKAAPKKLAKKPKS